MTMSRVSSTEWRSSGMKRDSVSTTVAAYAAGERLGVVLGDVVDSRARHEASDRGVRTLSIINI
jgi:hypothetical protein